MTETDRQPLPEGWEMRGAQHTLFRRFVFERYAQTRVCIEALAAMTEPGGTHPQSINFGSTYVNVTLAPTPNGDADVALAECINALLGPPGGQK
jgi:4a-hydroxytetrahydrobiopterin dehydratase